MQIRELDKRISSILQKGLKPILKKLDVIIHNQKKQATKADIEELGKKIHLFMQLVTIYREKQIELEEELEAILEYLDMVDN